MNSLTPAVKRNFSIILGLAFICLIFNIPQSIPVKIHWGKINWEHTFYRPELNFRLGNFDFSRKFDFKFGLDLAGGTSLLMLPRTN